jgi:general secretion pathway protein M
MDAIKNLFSPLQARWAQLSTREQRLLLLMGGAVSLFILFVIIFSFSSSAASTTRRTEAKLSQLRQVQELAANYNQAEQQRRAAEQQLSRGDFRLISYLEERASQAGVSINSMNPKPDVTLADGRIQESAVDVTLTDVNARQLVDFLNSVEGGPGVVKVKYVRVEPRPANDNVTAWATVSTYRLKQ